MAFLSLASYCPSDRERCAADAQASHRSKTCPFQDELQSDAKSCHRFGRARARAGFPSFVGAPPRAAGRPGCYRQMKGLGRLGPSSGREGTWDRRPRHSQHITNHRYQRHSLEFRQSGFKSQFRHFPSVLPLVCPFVTIILVNPSRSLNFLIS